MNKVKQLFTVGLVAAAAMVSADAQACTGISFTAKDGSYVMARTMEWAGEYMPYGYVIIPRGEEIISYTPTGMNGVHFTAKYGAVGIAPHQKEFVIEGVNEEGLSAGLFYFPGYGKYVEYDQSRNSQTLCDMQFVTWVLSCFSSVDEVKEALSSVDIVSIGIEGNTSTVHWRIGDTKGRQVILEFIDGKAVFYDNPLGVLTNSPEFSWHLTNLNNYIHLFGGSAKATEWNGVKLAPFGSGSGSLGLPGDLTSPGRFVRAAYYTVTAPPQHTALKTVTHCFHILNNFDIPIGAEFAAGEAPDVPSATPCTTVTDLKGRRFYYRTNYNSAIRCISLANIDFDYEPYAFHPLEDKLEEPIIEICR